MLIIAVTAKIKPEFEPDVLAHMKVLAEKVRAEKGALRFEQNLSIDEPNKLFIYEEWQSDVLFQQHLTSTHMQEHFVKVEPWVESIEMQSYEAKAKDNR